MLDDTERAFAACGDEPYEDPAGRPTSVLANVPAGIAFLRAVLARLRGDAALTAGYNQQALAHLAKDERLMRSFVRWNQAGVHWLDGRLGPAERGLAEVLAGLRAAGEAVRRLDGKPTKVFRAVEGGAEFFAGFLANASATTWARYSAPRATWMLRWPPPASAGGRWRKQPATPSGPGARGPGPDPVRAE